MKPYIYGKRNSVHIINIKETLLGLLRAQKFLARLVGQNQDVLFVGTKRQARDIVAAAADRCGMHYVNERWLGGTLTNFRTIRSRLQRLEELEATVNGPTWETGYSKKMQSTIQRELKKILRNLGGIRKMTRLPGALIVVDVRKEANAIHEAKSLGIPTLSLIDTDGDPDRVSIPIPGNDDAMRSIELVMNKLADAIDEGKRARPEPSAAPLQDRMGPGGEGDGGRPRRARRGPGAGRGEGDAAQPEAATATMEPGEAPTTA